MPSLQLVCLAALLAGVTIADVANFIPCEEYSPDACTVHQLHIDPCSNRKMCRMRKGHPATMSIDFTPNFSVSKLKIGLFWANNARDIPFPDLQDADGCQYTTCPTESGKSQNLTYELFLNKKLPQGTYLFKMKLWDENDESQACCFKTTVQLRK